MSFKLFALLLVLGVATQANPSGEPKDLRTVIENAIAIARIIGDAVAKGIDDATPSIQAIEGQMNTDLAAKLKGLLLRIKADVGNLNANIKSVEEATTASVNSVNSKAGACIDQSGKDLKPILNKYGKYLADLITSIGDDNRADLDGVYAAVKDLGERLHATNTNGIKGGDACITPGKAGVKECLDANGVVFTSELSAGLGEAKALIDGPIKTLVNGTLSSYINQLQPQLNASRADADVVIAGFGTCVENLS